MGSYMEIFEARVFGENLSFWLKNHQYWELCQDTSILKPIQDNDIYKPHAKNYSNLYIFTQVIA
jgi:hypothetical protein